jgi:hypothetical protein
MRTPIATTMPPHVTLATTKGAQLFSQRSKQLLGFLSFFEYKRKNEEKKSFNIYTLHS